MKPVILFRKESFLEKIESDVLEHEICQKYIPTYFERTSVPHGSLVVGRYSVLPFYRELERDLAHSESTLINSYQNYSWVANFQWYYDCEELRAVTPTTWREHEVHILNNEDGPFVVKGATNSRKHEWYTHMFAEYKMDLLDVMSKLRNDPLICTQDLLVRKYIPLKTFEVGINGLPFTNEWRFFFLGKNLLTYGYYWTGLDDKTKPHIDVKGIDFACGLANIISEYTNFFVLDIAETVDGKWILIEINDGQMSGLSENDPQKLYDNMKKALTDN